MKRLPLILILLVAAFFRFYQLDRVPPSPSLDEVSIGYNAFSLLRTGKDEYGSSFPLLLRAYDDYRPALYVYLAAPFVWVLGLTATAVRLPAVLLSLATVYVTYALGKMLGKKYLSNERLGEIAAGVLAISPWHIYLSRLGHEVNLGLTLTAVGVYFLLRATIEGKRTSWIIAATSLGLSLHGYQSEKIVSPLIVVLVVSLFWKSMWNARAQVIVAALAGLVIAVPAIYVTLTPSGLARLRGTNTFSSDQTKLANASTVLRNYASHFSPRWVFWGSNREAHKIPGLGLLYIWEAPFLLLGLWAIGKYAIPSQIGLFLMGLVLVSPIPASITTQAPHAMRSFTMIPAIEILEALGFWVLGSTVFKKRYSTLAMLMGLLVASSMVVLWKGYFVRFPREQSDSFQYAIGSAIAYAQEREDEYQSIEFSHQGALYQSYMFYLFQSRLDPNRYLALGGTGSGGYEATHYIGKYAFGFIPEDSKTLKSDILYFYDVALVPEGARVIQEFQNLDGKVAIVAVRKAL